MSKKNRSRWTKRANAHTEPEAPATHELTLAKLAANRANAQLSTGATTEAGKAIVSQNATKHGLTGTFHVLPDESQSDFDRLLGGFLRAEEPADDAEAQMVLQMAEALWLSNRSIRFQDKCLIAIQSGTPQEQRIAHKELALFLRYQTTHDRTYSRYAAELRKRRNERRRVERGFVSQERAEAQQQRRAELDKHKQELHELKILIQKARLERIQTPKKAAKPTPDQAISTENCLAAAA